MPRRVASSINVPPYHELLWPTLTALKSLGGSGSIQEINDKAIEHARLTDDQVQVLHGDGPQSEVAYRLHWARTYLKAVDAVTNTSRGVWAITERGRKMSRDDMSSIPRQVRAMTGRRAKSPQELQEPDDLGGASDTPMPDALTSTEPAQWRQYVLDALLSIPPDAFERLCQRVLRESGFTKVDVTGRSGDGGIDGIGVLRVSLLSFQVFFQCKRYRGSVGAPAIRDFRGAMVGRTDKGLFITTGSFTPEAKREATRDGAPVLDLIDGDAFCILLKDLKLGITTEMVEAVTVNADWFRSL